MNTGVKSGSVITSCDTILLSYRGIEGSSEDLASSAITLEGRCEQLVEHREVRGPVKDLVTGSGLTFHDHGEHELKGVPQRWRLFAASSR